MSTNLTRRWQTVLRVARSANIGYRAGFLSMSLIFGLFGTTLAQTTPVPSPSPGVTRTKPAGEKPSPPASIPTGSIKGRVVSDDGRVVGNAIVLARALGAPMSMKSAVVDTDGRFAMNDVPASVYQIFAMAPGYVDETMSSEVDQWPKYLVGSQLTLRLLKGGVITGTVTDSKSLPIVGVPVRATSLAGLTGIMGGYNGVGMAETDDRGVYRIYGLPPGQYLVDAGGGGQSIRFSSSGFDLDAPTYYPSSTYETTVPVSVRAAEETAGIDIRYRGGDGHALSGKVSGKLEGGALAEAVSIVLSHAGTSNVMGMAIAGISDQSRTFGFDGLADGDYELTAIFVSNLNESVAAASRKLTVRGSDISGVELALTPLASVSGIFKLEPAPPEVKCNQRESQLLEVLIELPRDDPKKTANKVLATMLAGFGISINANGEFVMRNVESGVYRPKIRMPSEAWYVRSIDVPAPRAPVSSTAKSAPAESELQRGGSPPTVAQWQGTLNIKPGEKMTGISIALGQDAAGVSGNLSTKTGEGSLPPGFRVHLVPADREHAANVLRYFETSVDTNGGFAFSNVAPGRYLVLARPEPDFDARARPAAMNVTNRTVLRREAEAFNRILELKSCQRMTELNLKISN